MDNLTHSLFGLTLARTPLSRAGRGTTAALLLASSAPDIDIVVTASGGASSYLDLHRGPTHGPLGVVGLALVVAALAWAGTRRWDRETGDPPASFLMLWAVSAIGIVCHVLMDLPTSYGTRPLSPFLWTWFTTDWMPIVDVVLLAILGGGLWWTRSAADLSRRHRGAAIALALVLADYGVRAVAHQAALRHAGEAFGDRLPAWCADAARPDWRIDWWPRRPGTSPRDLAANDCLLEIAATPGFGSPFSWRLIAQTTRGYEVRDIELVGPAAVRAEAAVSPRELPVYVPNQWTPAVVRAAAAPSAQVFLRFSRFPAVNSTIDADGTATVQWSDMRFTPPVVGNGRELRRGLFGATVVVAPDGSILRHRLGN